MKKSPESAPSSIEGSRLLCGLLLTGGRSRRMGGVDKATLIYQGVPQILRAQRLLGSLCSHSFVSIRESDSVQEADPAQPSDSIQPSTPEESHLKSNQLPCITDIMDIGPMGGLHAAFSRFPNHAWLVLAVDMPLVNREILKRLTQSRNTQFDATAYSTSNGLQPLCAIYEPTFIPHINHAIKSGKYSLRRALNAAHIQNLPCTDERLLSNVNTPAEYQEITGTKRSC